MGASKKALDLIVIVFQGGDDGRGYNCIEYLQYRYIEIEMCVSTVPRGSPFNL
jgi:hypothetical protein